VDAFKPERERERGNEGYYILGGGRRKVPSHCLCALLEEEGFKKA
jgi:hypothetical protein